MRRAWRETGRGRERGGVRGLGRVPGVGLVAVLVAAIWLVAGMGSAWAQVGEGDAQPVQAVATSNQAENLAIITIRGPIDGYTSQSVKRRIESAERSGADAIVFELDTPGGELKAALEICNAIKGSSVPLTVAWVHPDAYSAGAVIALSCSKIISGDPATMGDALPILAGPFGFQGFNDLPEHERQKVLSPLIAEVVNSARRNGYDEMLVQAIVSRGVELWLVREKDTGRMLCVTEAEYRTLFDGDPPRAGALAPSASAGTNGLPSDAGTGGTEVRRVSPLVRPDDFYRPAGPGLEGLTDAVNDDLIEQTTRPVITEADRGRYELVMYVTSGSGPLVMKAQDLRVLGVSSAIVRGDQALETYFGAKNVVRLDESWSERLARVMVMMPVRFVLVVIFLISIFVEMTHPGATVPAFIAMLALGALIAPSMIVGMASWWEIAAILGGVLMLVIELFVVPGFGVFGIAGIVLLFAGLIGVMLPGGDRLFPGETGTGGSAFYAVAMLVAAVVTSGVLIYFLVKHLGDLPIVNRLVLRDEAGGVGTLGAMAAPGALGAAAPGGLPAVGATGRAMTDLRPSGRAEIGGHLVDVVAELGYIPAGSPVRVVSSSSIRVGVEMCADSRAPGAAPAEVG